nr:RING/U-box superfamily protein [Tanacetum cinerariifolium]
MVGSCNGSFSQTLCSICYEDLKPIVEDLQSISICGHVFHELCLQQWFEYCPKVKKNCPFCKQKCTTSNVSRLYFQSVGESNDPKLSQKQQTSLHDPEELKLEYNRLKGKVNGLNTALESRENDLEKTKNELGKCKEQLKKEAAAKNEALEQTQTINQLFNLKTQELIKSDMKCIKLQERNMALAKELAALKLVSDLNLDEDEIVKLASLGTEAHSKESVDILKRSLVVRNKTYKDLIAKYSTLAREEARSRAELEKTKEKLEKFKTRIQKTETTKEEKDNEVLRALKALKKRKLSSSVVNEVDPTRTTHDTLKEPDVLPRKAKRSRESEIIDESNNKDGASSYILIDDDAPPSSVSPKSSPFDTVPQPLKKATPDSSYSPNTLHETSKYNGVPLPNNTDDDDVVFVHDIGQDKSLPKIVKEAPSPVLNSQEGNFSFSAGVLGPDGIKRHLGKWCKKSQSKGINASPVPGRVSGDLIAVGSDGRGGTIKVLKSQNLASPDSKKPSLSAKNGKFVAKTSSLHSRGGLQIDHFFRKADQ